MGQIKEYTFSSVRLSCVKPIAQQNIKNKECQNRTKHRIQRQAANLNEKSGALVHFQCSFPQTNNAVYQRTDLSIVEAFWFMWEKLFWLDMCTSIVCLRHTLNNQTIMQIQSVQLERRISSLKCAFLMQRLVFWMRGILCMISFSTRLLAISLMDFLYECWNVIKSCCCCVHWRVKWFKWTETKISTEGVLNSIWCNLFSVVYIISHSQ